MKPNHRNVFLTAVGAYAHIPSKGGKINEDHSITLPNGKVLDVSDERNYTVDGEVVARYEGVGRQSQELHDTIAALFM